MKSILLSSSKKSQAAMKSMYEISPDLLNEVAGGVCSCQDKKVTKVVDGDTTTWTVDDK